MNKTSYNFLPYGKQTITSEDINEVTKVLNSAYLTQGPKVAEFESAVSKKLLVDHAIAVNSATSALHIACLALGLQSGDCLWTSPITFVASANCGIYCGASVDFVDIERSNGLISTEKLRQKLKIAKKNGTLPKIIVPVHLSGSSCNMEEIYKLSKEYGFKVIEDASHAIGGTYKGTPVGSCKYSSITIFSFHPVKIITTGEGGMATTNCPLIAKKMSEYRSHGIVKDKKNFVGKMNPEWKYEQQSLGFNYRLSDISAALGLSQLSRLDSIVKERNKLYNNYKKLLINMPIRLLSIPKDVLSSVHLAIIYIEINNKKVQRYLYKSMRDSSIGVQVHYMPVHLQPFYQKLGFKLGDFPESELYSNKVLSLPLYPGLTYQDQDRVINTISSLIKKFV